MSLEHKYNKYKTKYFSLKNSLNKSVILNQQGGVIQEHFTFADATYLITDDGITFSFGGPNRINDRMCNLFFNTRNPQRRLDLELDINNDTIDENIQRINDLPQELKELFIDYCNRVIIAVNLKLADQANDWLPPFRNIWLVRINILRAILNQLNNNNNNNNNNKYFSLKNSMYQHGGVENMGFAAEGRLFTIRDEDNGILLFFGILGNTYSFFLSRVNNTLNLLDIRNIQESIQLLTPFSIEFKNMFVRYSSNIINAINNELQNPQFGWTDAQRDAWIARRDALQVLLNNVRRHIHEQHGGVIVEGFIFNDFIYTIFDNDNNNNTRAYFINEDNMFSLSVNGVRLIFDDIRNSHECVARINALRETHQAIFIQYSNMIINALTAKLNGPQYPPNWNNPNFRNKWQFKIDALQIIVNRIQQG